MAQRAKDSATWQVSVAPPGSAIPSASLVTFSGSGAVHWPSAMGGSGSTPMHAGYRAGDFRVIAGASVRLVIDVGDWDRSLCINAPGQSGDPRSPHYGDLAPAWAAGAYVPLLYGREAVEGAARRRIELLPESA